MKHKRIIRMLGMIILLSMLLSTVPALPVFAQTLSLNPSQAKIGDTINFTGVGYITNTGDPQYYVDIYITDQGVSPTVSAIDNPITRYKRLVWATLLETDGTFSGSFLLSSNLILNEGTLGLSQPLTLAPGATYNVFSTGHYSNPDTTIKSIRATTTLAILAPAALNPLSVTSGPAGTPVTVSGTGFPAGNIAITFDGAAVTITGGSTTTSGGTFASIITIPAAATVGAHTIGVTAGTMTPLTTTFTVTASATLNQIPAASPSSNVTITGANFPINTPIVFTFDTFAITPQSGALTTANGAINSVITIPATATVGAHTITVTVTGASPVSAQIQVTAPTPPPVSQNQTAPPPPVTPPPPPPTKVSLSINQSGKNIGALIGVGGAGFTPGANVTVKYEDVEVASFKADAAGTFIVTFNAPRSKAGDHTITATDGKNTGTVVFTVESDKPKVPPPLKPELGAEVKTPISFDWEDVNDASTPVSYMLQVAGDKSFSKESIVVDKRDIESSSYILSEAEELKLEVRQEAYYWRVKAVDAASNESEWTGAGEFFVPVPFSFTGWVLYAVLGVGALVFFLLGFWIGRRTAFYY